MLKRKENALKFRKFSIVCLLLSIVINVTSTTLGYTGDNIISTIGITLGIVLLLIFITISLLIWRCPFCKKRLPIRFDIKNNVDEVICPFCGANLLYGTEKEDKKKKFNF